MIQDDFHCHGWLPTLSPASPPLYHMMWKQLIYFGNRWSIPHNPSTVRVLRRIMPSCAMHTVPWHCIWRDEVGGGVGYSSTNNTLTILFDCSNRVLDWRPMSYWIMWAFLSTMWGGTCVQCSYKGILQYITITHKVIWWHHIYQLATLPKDLKQGHYLKELVLTVSCHEISCSWVIYHWRWPKIWGHWCPFVHTYKYV